MLRDYREAHGRYDAVVSVEMIEAVGAEYWPTYFATLDRLLAPGGRVGLQAITMPHDRMLASRASYTWIHKYVFPGGLIPSVRAIEESVREHTRLRIAETQAFGEDYARTLRVAGDVPRALGRDRARSGSTTRSAGCGSSTSPTPRPGSGSATSTCSSSAWPKDWAIRTIFYPKRVPGSPSRRTSWSALWQAVSNGSLRSLLQ